jgi:hypothetical protein
MIDFKMFFNLCVWGEGSCRTVGRSPSVMVLGQFSDICGPHCETVALMVLGQFSDICVPVMRATVPQLGGGVL